MSNSENDGTQNMGLYFIVEDEFDDSEQQVAW
jgi:hypothetical protein